MRLSGTPPLSDAEAAERFDRCGPFAPGCRIAAALSGGPDSSAMLHLLATWATARGFALHAFTVDHGLRPEARAEAEAAGRAAAALGLGHTILTRDAGPGTPHGQETLRTDRHRLLAEACRAAAIPHLFFAHHRDDQAETLLLRLAAGSGPDGLAAMASISETAEVRLLRPFLDVPKARLEALCAARGLAPARDPSNAEMGYGRGRLRAVETVLSREGLTPARAATLAHRSGRARAAAEAATAAAIAAVVRIDRAGFARIDRAAWATLREDLAVRLLGAVCATIGGSDRPPSAEGTERLHAALRDPIPAATALTLGGCVWSCGPERLTVVREAVRTRAAEVEPGRTVTWDGRFRVRLGQTASAGMTVRALGEVDRIRMLPQVRPDVRRRIPAAAAAALPALEDCDGMLHVPHLDLHPADRTFDVETEFRPSRPLAPAAFQVA